MWRLAQASRRGLAGQRALSSAPNFQVGSVVHGFEVLKKQTVPEYSITAIQLQHQATKAEYIHIDTVDTNNVFRYICVDPQRSLVLMHALASISAPRRIHPTALPTLYVVDLAFATYLTCGSSWSIWSYVVPSSFQCAIHSLTCSSGRSTTL
ncbi:unnamed protein product [Aphanomyces euteiches]